MALIRKLASVVLAFVLVLSVCNIQLSSEAAGRPYSSHGSTYPHTSQLSAYSSHGSTYPHTSQLSAVRFNQAFRVLWGPQHEQVSSDQSGITVWLDRTSGSGFKSLRAYNSGYFSAAIKLQAGYTAGVNTAFYLSNNEVHPDYHDEIDIEFLGTIPGEPYTLQTNIYVRAANVGSGRFVTGREQQIHLWFDPTKDFHRYSILWTPYKIVFSVDGVPIRKYPRTDASTFPTRPMWVYGSIWDASSWATDNGRYKVDYRYQPFVAKYTAFVITDCTQSKAVECS